MSDIVETNNGGFTVKNASYWRRQAINKDKEIESLRQLVKELEEDANDGIEEYTQLVSKLVSCVKELAASQQRVKELEETGARTTIAFLECNAELAALKQSQDKPVAWMWQHEETGRVGFTDIEQVTSGAHESLNPRLKLIAPLYTTAPTIPAGWQLVPKEPDWKNNIDA